MRKFTQAIFVLLSISGLLIVSCCGLFGYIASQADKQVVASKQETKPEKASNAETIADKSTSNTIPGLQPVDFYLNLTNKGFTKTGPTAVEGWGVSYHIDDKANNMTVLIYGPNTTEVESVQATIWGVENMNGPASEFFGYIATVPYDNSSPQLARDWVRQNINQNATTQIGDVFFTINANGPAARILTLSRKKR